MVVGFNHNFRYKGEVFHVQTEDSGLKSPHIITLLYRGGTILASKKTSYADITKVDNLDQVVEDLMKEQHREMLRRLKAGDFDAIIAGRAPAAVPEALKAEKEQAPPAPAPASPVPGEPALAAPVPASKAKEVKAEDLPPSLDDIIFSYLVGNDDSSK